MIKVYFRGICCVLMVLIISLTISCGKQYESNNEEWLSKAKLDSEESAEELYKAALDENILIVYTVSTRITKVKEQFEAEYPGLSVEVRDLRSPDLVEAVWNNYQNGGSDCDVVICNDNSGTFVDRLVNTEAVYAYMPSDIKKNMKQGTVGETVTLVNEAELLFYNSSIYDECPIDNIWELTEDKYNKKIYMPNPMRSFSTYAFFGSVLEQSESLEAAYISLYGKKPEQTGNTVAEEFLVRLCDNAVFTNSSDEVYEALGSGSGDASFGIMVSSKMRMQDYGYSFEPMYNLTPFSGCKSSFAVMIASGSKNINTAKLFIRFLFGETDGSGEGYKPFITKGTWVTRTDVKDENDVLIDKVGLLNPDQNEMIKNKKYIDEFLKRIMSK